ncbi:hypothetical protein TNCV_2841741 [Trichonephila clavipes]|uniref:Uncharacterized protein n=1 Tax=Trichonephila clavipes TaxID=2585209 RepID=A0A8X6RRP5_TRICX|nr:hypothetical protein TNCV_2841741 [Trichonephila clavipes]
MQNPVLGIKPDRAKDCKTITFGPSRIQPLRCGGYALHHWSVLNSPLVALLCDVNQICLFASLWCAKQWRNGEYSPPPAKSGLGPQAGSYKGLQLGVSQALGSLESPPNGRGCGGVRYATGAKPVYYYNSEF